MEILLCRRICIATRGCTSSTTSNEAHVLRVECADTTGTPALLLCTLNRRGSRGSSGESVARLGNDALCTHRRLAAARLEAIQTWEHLPTSTDIDA
jgi:hypothetical protein